ncbi:MAG: methionine--tRNA ligase [Patescibacteria group bacterium]
MPKFYIVTPIYYINAEPHIGHMYTTVAADVLARYHRMKGDETFFLTGTDEHGEKNEEKAIERNMDPQVYADEMSAKFEMAWDTANISNDFFIRTTSPAHKAAVTKALQTLYDKGFIYKGEHKGLYCVGCEQYKTDKDLVEGKCPDHQKEPIEMSEESYMFKLSEFADELKAKIESDELEIRPVEKKREVLSFFEQGLNDISFSRKNLKWGIPIPWDQEHVAYVWPDALLNYLTGIGWQGDNQVPEMWPAQVQLMSKDIIRVHATIWPAMLLGLGLTLPNKLFVHGFFMVDGQKMSKSVGNVISPSALIEKYGVDATRYLLMSATTFGSDGDIGWGKFDNRYSADLANDLGNLLHRVLSMTEKYFEGKVPERHQAKESDILGEYMSAMNDLRIHEALDLVWSRIREANKFIEDTKPWELAKTDKNELEHVMYFLLDSLRNIAVFLYPFMPEKSEQIFVQLGLDFEDVLKRPLEESIGWGKMPNNGIISKGEPLFPRKD